MVAAEARRGNRACRVAIPIRRDCSLLGSDRLAYRHHLPRGRWRGAKLRPCLGNLPALLEQIATPIGSLYLVGDRVSERHFGDFGREGGALGRPIAQARSEAMRRQIAAADAP